MPYLVFQDYIEMAARTLTKIITNKKKSCLNGDALKKSIEQNKMYQEKTLKITKIVNLIPKKS